MALTEADRIAASLRLVVHTVGDGVAASDVSALEAGVRAPSTAVPLLVDLDHSLIMTDLLSESANVYLSSNPGGLWRLLGWTCQGRGALKSELSTRSTIDIATLPVHEGLFEWLQAQRAAGRRLVLVSGFDQAVAHRVFNHLGLFDELFMTSEPGAPGPVRKSDRIVTRFGAGKFDYVGDSWSDVPVFSAARLAHVSSSSPRLVARVEAHGNLGLVFPPDRPSHITALRRALRPHQWVKNILVFVPLLAAHLYGSVDALCQAMLALAVFCVAASSVYLLNDLVDVPSDRYHPRKRQRPFAAGDLGLLTGWLLWPVLASSAMAVAYTAVNPRFAACVAAYWLLTVAYSFKLKREPVIDVLALAGLYTMRIVAGAAAIAVPLSFWLLAFSVFLFLSLAFMKRYSELKRLKDADGDMASARGRGYAATDLEVVSNLGSSAGYVAVLVLAMYIQDTHTVQMYAAPEWIWAACPVLLYWISRSWMLAHRGKMHEDPVVFALKDRASWQAAAVVGLIFLIAKFGWFA